MSADMFDLERGRSQKCCGEAISRFDRRRYSRDLVRRSLPLRTRRPPPERAVEDQRWEHQQRGEDVSVEDDLRAEEPIAGSQNYLPPTTE